MKDRLNPKKIFSAYEQVMALGQTTPNGKVLSGIEAFSDHEGYLVHLRGEGVDLKVCSMHRFHLDYNKSHCRDTFLKKLSELANH
ncbi:DUF3081 family protein [Vibrio sp. ZSDE26]|uniref:DUF3081 family protein n=1 Tax=Vibrio amylolyticus TaxID=2847292 RepID=A0A9X1XRA0_9VIBR|nr:DUF3081 family protein [Vibrio amylolyticus]MCK6264129.1 DUF3081 family protein [Vibrio amylolyticus]